MTDTDYAAELQAACDVDDLAVLCIRHADAPLADTASGAEQQNALRGLLAASGVVPYLRRCRTTDDEFEAQIADMVCDLRHLADALKVDWGEVGDRVESNYAAEVCGV